MLSENDNADPGERAMRADLGEDANQPSGDRVEQTPAAHIQCSVCSSTFRRPEHLKRHLRSHTKEKPFECTQCGRHFSRSDTLHRHELSYHTLAGEGGKDRMHRITVKTFRACFSCAAARVRCSGGIPCGRCETRSLECQYPTKRRSKARVRNGTSPELPSADMHERELQIPQPSSPQLSGQHAEPMQVDHAVSQPMLHFSVKGVNESQPPLEASTNPLPHSMEAHSPSERKGFIARASDSQLYSASSSAGSLAALSDADRRQQHNEISSTNMSKLYWIDSAAGVASGTRDLKLDRTSAGVNNETDVTRDQEMSIEFDTSFFDQSMLSTLNWLPSEFVAGTSHDQAQPGIHSHWSPSAVSNTHAARLAWQPPLIHNGQTSPSITENVSLAPSGHFSLGTDIGGPRQYSHVAGESSPRPGSIVSAKRSTDYCVGDSGAQLPKYRKNQVPLSTPGTVAGSVQPLDEHSAHQFAFPSVYDLHAKNVSDQAAHSVRLIDTPTHSNIYRNFLLLCRNDNPFFKEFESEKFPSADDCNRYLACYFHSFHAVAPLFHLPTFDPNRCHWILTLAIVAIGCHYSGIQETDQCTAAFHEMIRRAICFEKERSFHAQLSLDLMQAILLNSIGLLHGESEGSQLAALSTFKDIVTLFNREKLLASSPELELAGPSEESLWAAWIQDEVRRRTGYSIWLLDCTLAYYFDDRPFLSLDDGQAPLPAHEKLWQASDAQAWRQLWDQSSVNESLYDAVHILYIEKRLVTGIGEFSHILLIHALYHRMWEVGDYFRRPLSFWNPTAKKQSRETAVPTGSVWLPGIPSYSKWRNSACDCLDILAWTANSSIAKAPGLEKSTVLHLHAARLVLLAPFREIRSLATSLTTGKLQWSQRQESLEWQYIWRWVKHDQYKARLSVIHAGATLWHVGRYSTHAFQEPVAVFLAVLILWAYGSCHPHDRRNPSSHIQASGAESLRERSLIQLDRPCDDELVQLFVRDGHSMRGNLTGVGDICAPEAPKRILQVGSETLSSLMAWGISKRFITMLTRLADVIARHAEVETNRNVDIEG